jgi:hypothetical protein
VACSRRGWLPSARSTVTVQQSAPEAGGRVTQDLALATVHQVGLHGITVVPPDEVQRRVRGEQIELQRHRHADAPSLSERGVGGDDDLAHERARRSHVLERKREHIRSPPNAAPPRVELAHLAILDDRDVDEAGRAADRSERPIDGAAQTRDRDGNAALALLDGRGHQERSGRTPSSRAAAARVS